IQASEFRFVPVDATTLRYGLGAVRGTGEAAIGAIVDARQAGPFKDLFDLCRRVDKRAVNRRVIEALIRAGALDTLESNRASLLATAGRALDAAEQRERQGAQVSLFGDAEDAGGAEVALIAAKPWDLKQQLTEEKAALGFALSGHLFSVYEREIAGFPRVPLAQLAAAEHRVWLAGVVASARTQMTRRGRMMVVMLDDGSAQLELSVFNELFEKHRDKLKEDALLIVQGKAQRDDFSGGLRVTADELYDLAALRARFAARLRLQMNGHSDAHQLMDLLAPYRSEGACPVTVHYETGAAACDVALGDAWRVRPDEQLLERLGAWLAPENVQVIYAGGA
ncbi:MAG: OB-fold nucleic acid binding domain-containing protein, partial [Betaproteobacteria bacterium]|nr:OB-fold nucleic acid binding domain-containing protein [Betaproteobacteria bacterium]